MPKPDIYYGPAETGDSKPKGDWSNALFVPSTYRGLPEIRRISSDELRQQGLAFALPDFPRARIGARNFLKRGIISQDRTMVVIFCDLKGSTGALRSLRGRFRDVQDKFFENCSRTVAFV